MPSGTIRVIVCGGRHFADAKMLNDFLDHLHATYPIRVVISGGQRGADKLGEAWARANGIEPIVEPVGPAEWLKYGKAAGPIRNQLMIDKHHPSHCVAFPGNKGTRDMVKRAKKAGLTVIECSFPPSLTRREEWTRTDLDADTSPPITPESPEDAAKTLNALVRAMPPLSSKPHKRPKE